MTHNWHSKLGFALEAGGPGCIGKGRATRALYWHKRPARVGDVRYSLLCVHWAQCKGARSRAGNARRRSRAGPTWTFTPARTQASGRISATCASSASRRSRASIYISGRTQVGHAARRTALARPLPTAPSRRHWTYIRELTAVLRARHYDDETYLRVICHIYRSKLTISCECGHRRSRSRAPLAASAALSHKRGQCGGRARWQGAGRRVRRGSTGRVAPDGWPLL